MHSEKMSAFRANRTEKVGAFRANKTQKKGGGLYCGTYPYYFNMRVSPRHDKCLLKTILWGFHPSLLTVEKDVQILVLAQMPIP